MLKNNLSRRAFVGSSLAGAATLVLAGCGGSNGSDANSGSGDSKPASGEKTKLTFCLDYTPNTNHTGIYVAKTRASLRRRASTSRSSSPPTAPQRPPSPPARPSSA